MFRTPYPLTVMVCLLFPLLAQAQTTDKSHFTIAYRYGGFTEPINDAISHREQNHILEIAYWIRDRYAIVPSVNLIRSNFATTSDLTEPARTYNLSFRRNFSPGSRLKVYLELGGGVGNYCNCEDGLPERIDNLRYLRYGTGVDYFPSSHFGLGIHFQSNNIIDPIAEKYAYNVLTFGANLAIGRKRNADSSAE